MSNMTDRKAKTIPKNLPWGVYVWRTADGGVLNDGHGNVLALDGFKNDLEAIRKMRSAATALGHGDGKVAFIPGSRGISHSEWEDQMEAAREGHDIPGDIDA